MKEKFLIVWGPQNKRRCEMFADIKGTYPYSKLFPVSGSEPTEQQIEAGAQLYELRKKDFNLVLEAKLEEERTELEARERQQLRALLNKYPDEVSGSV